jgi:hypothetical protein
MNQLNSLWFVDMSIISLAARHEAKKRRRELNIMLFKEQYPHVNSCEEER